MDDPVLEIQDLQTYYFSKEGVAKAVDGVSLSLPRGSALGIVGESGCGKTTVGLSVLNLVPYPGRIVGGRILFGNREITAMSNEELRRVRGREISMIFQDPVTGLNPVLPIGVQVEEILSTHLSLSREETRRRSLQLLHQSGLPNPERVAAMYPFHLSGGMCQRVMIAIATALNPKVIIADEPTSSLDVTIQAAILEELDGLRRQHGMSVVLITHDLGVVAQMADRVAVMYAGRVVEEGTVAELFKQPRHPYSWGLLQSLPRLDGPRRPLLPIKGAPPPLTDLPPQCAFLPRCRKAVIACRNEPAPALVEVAPGRRVACFNPILESEE